MTVLAVRYGVGVATALALAIRLANTLGELVAVAILELGYLAWRLRPRGSREQLSHGLARLLVARRPEPLRQHA